jgi:hypothetical protein
MSSDKSKTKPETESGAGPKPQPEPKVEPEVFDFGKIGEMKKTERPEERKERARETIAFMLVFGLLALFISSFLFAGTVDEAIKLIQAISSALSGLIGAVLGYYYGTEVAQKATSTTTPQE